MRFELPRQIVTRRDGLQMWLHLIERNVAYHWEDDPADFSNDTGPTFTPQECEVLRRLNRQVSASTNRYIEDDACRLFKFATYLGPDMVKLVDIDDDDAIHASYLRLRKVRAKAELRRQRRVEPIIDDSLFMRAA